MKPDEASTAAARNLIRSRANHALPAMARRIMTAVRWPFMRAARADIIAEAELLKIRNASWQ